MARLDALIERLVAEGASELLFASGSGATLATAHGPVPLIRQPLTTEQIVGAVAEILPEVEKPGFPRPVAFKYRAPAGPVDVKLVVSGPGVQVRIARPRVPEPELEPTVIRPLPGAATPPPVPAAGPPPAAALTAPAPAAPGAAAPAPRPPRPAIARPQDPLPAMEALLDALESRRASDLHLSSDCPPAFRVDGDIEADAAYGTLTHERLKELLWSIAPERNREEWHARKDTDFAHENASSRFRVNVFADRKGIGAVIRRIPSRILSAEEMGLPPCVLDLCQLTKGLVLVTGPTGSGKSTTLAAMIDVVNRTRSDHIITVEDPIEFVHPNKQCLINQREVGIHTGSFKSALRAALREDPDVVLVGELRDLETISIAIETAETGHLVFGTLHTNTAPSTVDRMIDQFPADRQAQIRTMLSESLRGVITQTLCKKVGGGRVPALEILLVSSGVANLIREGKTFQIPSIMQTGRAQGMATLNDALLDLVKRKVVEPREALAKAVAKADLASQLERAGIKLDAAA
jgi:twitching motility protein PilT